MDDFIVTDRRSQIGIIITVVVSILLFSVDYSMLNISLPTIASYFHVNLATVSFLPMLYILIVTSTLLGFGRLGDIKGYKLIFMAGAVIFFAGAVGAIIAPNFETLLAARMTQALGEAMFSPVGIAILTTFLPSAMKGRALGFVALAQGLGFAFGNVLGGFITGHFTWRGIFVVDIPLAIAVFMLAAKVIPVKQPEAAEKRFDIMGSALIFVAVATLLYALSSLQKIQKSDPLMPWCFGVSAIAFAVFFLHESRIAYPILDLRFFRNKHFTFANMAAFCAVCVFMGMGFIGPFYLEYVMHTDVTAAGLFLLIPSLTMMICAPVAGRLSDRMGSRVLSYTGTLLMAAAFTVFSVPRGQPNVFVFILGLFLLGMAAGVFMAPNNRLIMLHAPINMQGVASGVYKIFMNIGSVFGIAVLPVIIMRSAVGSAGKMGVLLADLKHRPDILETAFRSAFVAGIIISTAGFVFAFLARDKE